MSQGTSSRTSTHSLRKLAVVAMCPGIASLLVLTPREGVTRTAVHLLPPTGLPKGAFRSLELMQGALVPQSPACLHVTALTDFYIYFMYF